MYIILLLCFTVRFVALRLCKTKFIHVFCILKNLIVPIGKLLNAYKTRSDFFFEGGFSGTQIQSIGSGAGHRTRSKLVTGQQVADRRLFFMAIQPWLCCCPSLYLEEAAPQ